MSKPHVGRLQLYWELHCTLNCFSWQIYRSITIKSKDITYGYLYREPYIIPLLKVTSLQEKSTGCLIFWRKKDSKFLLDTLQSTIQEKFRAEDLHHTYCRYFRTNLLLWWSIFDGTNIPRTDIYRKTFVDVSCIMITSLFPVTCVKKFLRNAIGFTIFYLSKAVTEGVLLEKVFWEISQNSQQNQSLFLNKFSG